MKKLLSVIFYGLNIYTCSAQTESLPQKNITLAKDQLITIKTQAEQTSYSEEMVIMTSNSSTTSLLLVNDEVNDHYRLSNTISKIAISFTMMETQTSFDSDKESDRNTEIGKEVSSQIGKPEIFLIDTRTGKLSRENKEDKLIPADLKAAEGIRKRNELYEKLVADAFFVIPAGKRKTDSWSISDSSGKKKSMTTYTIASIEGDYATLIFTGNVVDTKNIEMNDIQGTVQENSKTTGQIVLNVKKGLVKEKRTITETERLVIQEDQSNTMTTKDTFITNYIY